MFKKNKKRNLAILVASIMCMSTIGFSSVSAMNSDNNIGFSSQENANTLEWLRNKLENLKQYMLGVSPILKNNIQLFEKITDLMKEYNKFIPLKYAEILEIDEKERYMNFNKQIKINNCLIIFEEMMDLLEMYYKQTYNLNISYLKTISQRNNSNNPIGNIDLGDGMIETPSNYFERLEKGNAQATDLKNSLSTMIQIIELYNDPSKNKEDKHKKVIDEKIKNAIGEIISDNPETMEVEKTINTELFSQTRKLVKRIMTPQNMVNTKCSNIYNEVKSAALELQKKLLEQWSGNKIEKFKSLL